MLFTRALYSNSHFHTYCNDHWIGWHWTEGKVKKTKVIVKCKILWTLQIVCSYKILFRFFSCSFFFSKCRYCASWARESLNSLQPFSSPDVRTQAMYQLLDTGFIGLIFSCFSEDAQKVRVYHKLFIFVWTFSRLFWNELHDLRLEEYKLLLSSHWMGSRVALLDRFPWAL